MSDGIRKVVRVNPITLLEEWGLGRRVPTRPAHLRQSTFNEQFDFDTLWYDQFISPDGSNVVLVGPPLFNLERAITTAGAGFFADGRVLERKYSEKDRCSEIWLTRSGDTGEEIVLKGRNFSVSLAPQQNHADWFAGKRVACTLSKDNDLQWIFDWAEYHATRHGLEAILIYDNASTRYSPDELLRTIASVQGISTAVVVVWPFLYGPQGSDGGKSLLWDSDFCQHGALTHARWRFLSSAKCVLNCDIDELVVTPKGSTIFSLCENSATGYVPFGGKWCFVNSSPSQSIRHRDHLWTTPSSKACARKWAITPAAAPYAAQWRVHDVRGNIRESVTAGVFYWHFRSVNNSWKWHRAPEFGPKEQLLNKDLAGLFN